MRTDALLLLSGVWLGSRMQASAHAMDRCNCYICPSLHHVSNDRVMGIVGLPEARADVIKIAAMVGAPDLRQETLAAYSGDFEIAIERLATLGYDGVEIMTKNPKTLNVAEIKRLLDKNRLALAGFCTGHVYGEDKLGLVDPDPIVCQMAMARIKDFIDVAAAHFGAGIWVNIGRARGNGIPGDLPATLKQAAAAFRDLPTTHCPTGSDWYSSQSMPTSPRTSPQRRTVLLWRGVSIALTLA